MLSSVVGWEEGVGGGAWPVPRGYDSNEHLPRTEHVLGARRGTRYLYALCL